MNQNHMTRSVLVRRNAALTMICACVESGKPHAFIPWLISTMIDEVLPVEKCEPHKLVGFLLVARHSFSHLNKCHDKINNPETLATHLCQVKWGLFAGDCTVQHFLERRCLKLI